MSTSTPAIGNCGTGGIAAQDDDKTDCPDAEGGIAADGGVPWNKSSILSQKSGEVAGGIAAQGDPPASPRSSGYKRVPADEESLVEARLRDAAELTSDPDPLISGPLG